ncbi:hypothetical protein [Phytohabitans aurantiacus]|uniref:Fibronectin type-III domain-containing protein n=1 Tax=Phytohabitans aurantiacus TaxID=3016789 RepID=A0ABQ5QS08_9ACTN|nr:hypothetical protein [Phytohabitans aurantiacus]GLH96772.1 hypothetical protein Pa4123_20460 [Phytohabitans aurantiacus]
MGRRILAALIVSFVLVGGPAVPAAASVVFTEDFESGSTAAWQFAGGRWGLASDGSRVLRQTLLGIEHARATAGDAAWTGYTVAARVKPTSISFGRSATGIVARAGTGDQGYLLALRPGNRVELIRSRGGLRTVLATAALTVRAGTWYGLRLRVDGDQLQGTVSGATGTATLTATDAGLAAGPVALFTDRAAATFDDVVVDSIPPPRDTQPPSTPGVPRLLEVTPTTATITWPASTDNVGVTAYWVYFGTQFYEDYPVRQVPSNAPVTLPIGGTTGYSLHFSVRAVDAAGNQSPLGQRVTFPQPPTVPRTGQDTVPPTAPGTPVVTGMEGGSAVITWAPATDNEGIVEYHVVHAFNFDEVRVRAKVPGTVTSAVVTPASIPNQVWVIAYDASWNSSRSAAITLTPTTTPPTPSPN